MLKRFSLIMALLLGLTIAVGSAMAASWELINPKGIADVDPITVAPHSFDTLNGKTVVLRANGKHNSDNFLDRIAELLLERFPQINLIKFWESDERVSGGGTNNLNGAVEMGQAMANLKADLVISSQAD